MYGLLECPGIVVVDEEFELVVGLTEDADDELPNDPMTIFPEDAVVEVMIRAPGCVVRAGETWRQALPIAAGGPLPAVRLHLTVPGSERYLPSRTIKAVYSVPGRTLGLAVRSFAVARTKADVDQTAAPEPAGTATVSSPSGPRNDLEIVIQHDGSGNLSWSYTSADPRVARLDAPVTKSIGGNSPDRFAMYLLETVDRKAEDVDLAQVVTGFGRMIGETIPDPVWEALRTVARAVPPGEYPNVLILSEEPFIPWELARRDDPLRPDGYDGQGEPPVLGGQVRIGRWAMASKRPSSPPPDKLAIEQMAVISGRYRRWRIKEAEREASDLRGKYHAADVTAMLPAVTKCLKGQPRAEAIHFALHGRYSPEDRRKDGLLLIDGKVLGPVAVSGHTLDRQDGHRPLVFLNACQVGTGDAVLGIYAGMGGAFLTAGAAAVIAPLWSVDDAKAHAVALQFYEQVFQGDVSPGEFIRRLRAEFRSDTDVVDTTPLAYQFFGHPQLTVTRSEVPEPGPS